MDACYLSELKTEGIKNDGRTFLGVPALNILLDECMKQARNSQGCANGNIPIYTCMYTYKYVRQLNLCAQNRILKCTELELTHSPCNSTGRSEIWINLMSCSENSIEIA